MDVIGAFLVDGLLEREADQPVTFTWAGTEYPCSLGAARCEKSLGPGGFALQADLAVVVRKSLFSTTPEPKQTVTVHGRTYRIDAIVNDPANDAFFVLELNDPTRGV